MLKGFDPSHKIGIEIYVLHEMISTIYDYESKLTKKEIELQELRAAQDKGSVQNSTGEYTPTNKAMVQAEDSQHHS